MPWTLQERPRLGSRSIKICPIASGTDECYVQTLPNLEENVRTALAFLTTDFAGGYRNRDGVLEEHLLALFESVVILSIIKKAHEVQAIF